MKWWPALAAAVLVFPTNTPKNDVLFELDGLRTMQADGSNRRSLTSGDLDREASWSPDGRHVVFARYRTDTRNWDLYSIRASGEDPKRLTRTDASERNPSWSPDGRLIAFDRGVKGIFLLRPGSGRVTRFSSGSLPTWSPNGSRLAFLRDGDLFVARRDGSEARRVRDLGGEVLAMDWSATGWLALQYYPEGRSSGVFIARPSGKRFHRIGRRGDSEPVWSPNGRRVLVSHESSQGRGIWRMDKDGTNRKKVADDGTPLDWIRR